jgi:hypothetical protein
MPKPALEPRTAGIQDKNVNKEPKTAKGRAKRMKMKTALF